MLLAVAGVRLADSPETRSSLLAALGRHPELIASLQMSGPEVISFDVSPDETHRATYDNNNHVRLYDVRSGALVAEFQAGSTARLEWVSGEVRFSPDGRILAVTRAAPTRASGGVARCPHARAAAEATQRDRRLAVAGQRRHFSQDGRRLAAIMWRVRGHGNTTHTTSTWGFVWDLDGPRSSRRPPAARRLQRRRPGPGHPRTNALHGPAARPSRPHHRRVVQLPEPWGVEEPVEIVAMSPTGRDLAVRRRRSRHARPAHGAVRRQMQVEPGDDALLLELLRRRPPSGYGRLSSTRGPGLGGGVRTSSWRGCPSTTRVSSLTSVPPGPRSTRPGRTARCASGTSTVTALRLAGGVRTAAVRRPQLCPTVARTDASSPIPAGDHVVFFDVTHGQARRNASRRTSGYRPAQPMRSGTPTASTSRPPPTDEIRVWDARTGDGSSHGADRSGRYVSALDYSTDGSRMVIGELSGAGDHARLGRPRAVAGRYGSTIRSARSHRAGQPDGHRARRLRERIGVLARLQPAVGQARPGRRRRSVDGSRRRFRRRARSTSHPTALTSPSGAGRGELMVLDLATG